VDCRRGQYSGVAVAECTVCPKGYYNDQEGSKECNYCDDLISRSSTFPSIWEEGKNSATSSDCVCGKGFFEMEICSVEGEALPDNCGDDYAVEFPLLVNRTLECRSISELGLSEVPMANEELIGMTVKSLVLKPNYWRVTMNSSKAEKCWRDDICLGGAMSGGEYQCREGHGGPLCSVCLDGHVMVDGLCEVCSGSKKTTAILWGIVLILVVIACAVMMFWKRADVKRRIGSFSGDGEKIIETGRKLYEKGDRYFWKLVDFSKLVLRYTSKTKVQLKVLASYCQITTQLSFTFDLHFPISFTSLMDWLRDFMGWFSFDLNLMQLGCVVQTNYLSNMYGQCVLYLVVMGGLFLGSLKSPERPLAGETNYKALLFNSLLIFTFLILPSVSTSIMFVFACKVFTDDDNLINDPSGNEGVFLKADYSVRCDDSSMFSSEDGHTAYTDAPEHHIAKMFASAMIIIFPVGIPLSYFVLLFRIRDKLDPGQDLLVGFKTVRWVNKKSTRKDGVHKKGAYEYLLQWDTPVGQARNEKRAGGSGEEIIVKGEPKRIKPHHDPFGKSTSSWLAYIFFRIVGWKSHDHFKENQSHHIKEASVNRDCQTIVLDENQALDCALYIRHELENGNADMSRLSFLYEAYEPRVFWFEVVESIRRLALTAGLIFIKPGTASQILISLLICFASMRIYSGLAPFIKDSHDFLVEIAQWQLFFTLLGALCIRVDITAEDKWNRATFDFILLAIQCVIPVLIFLQSMTGKGTNDVEEDGDSGEGDGDDEDIEVDAFKNAGVLAEKAGLGCLLEAIGGFKKWKSGFFDMIENATGAAGAVVTPASGGSAIESIAGGIEEELGNLNLAENATVKEVLDAINEQTNKVKSLTKEAAQRAGEPLFELVIEIKNKMEKAYQEGFDEVWERDDGTEPDFVEANYSGLVRAVEMARDEVASKVKKGAKKAAELGAKLDTALDNLKAMLKTWKKDGMAKDITVRAAAKMDAARNGMIKKWLEAKQELAEGAKVILVQWMVEQFEEMQEFVINEELDCLAEEDLIVGDNMRNLIKDKLTRSLSEKFQSAAEAVVYHWFEPKMILKMGTKKLKKAARIRENASKIREKASKTIDELEEQAREKVEGLMIVQELDGIKSEVADLSGGGGDDAPD
jgi:hypothetical protein